MRLAIVLCAALLLLAPAALAQQEEQQQQQPQRTADDCFDELYLALISAYQRFPKDEQGRLNLEQHAYDRFSRGMSAALIVPESHEAQFEQLLARLMIARRYDAVKREPIRRYLGDAAREIFNRQLTEATDRTTVRTPKECFDELMQRLRRCKLVLLTQHDLRGRAEEAADQIFGQQIGESVDSGGIDYVAVYTHNQRMADVQFPLPTSEQETRDPKLAEIRLRHQNANNIAKNANRRMLDQLLQK